MNCDRRIAANSRYFWQLHRLSFAMISLLLLTAARTQAQSLPDSTLPNPSAIDIQGNLQRIFGGTQAGSNLFHSFQDFNVPTGGTAYFDNALTIDNIITRVTGGRISNIDGLLRANGSANLFLLNPSGIVFGPNAQLNIGGSFFASTADSLLFNDGSSFSATNTGTTQPLLSINVPIGLQLGANPGTISVTGAGHQLTLENPSLTAVDGVADTGGLQVNRGETLSLIGGNITLDGGLLAAEQGQIDLAAVSGDSVNLSGADTDNTPASSLGNIQVTARSVADVSGQGGGAVNVRGQSLTVENGSRILADTLGAESGRAVTVNTPQLTVRNDALISASTFGDGRGGNLSVTAETIDITGIEPLEISLPKLFALTVENPAQIGSGLYTTTFAGGDAGEIQVNTSSLNLSRSAFISTATSSAGGAGVLRVNADSILLDGSEIFADAFGTGPGGMVLLQTRTLDSIRGGGIFASKSGPGNGGTVNIRATEYIDINGTTEDGQFNGGIGANAFGDASGIGGTIIVEAPEVRIRNGAAIGAATFAASQGGTVIIRASDLLLVSGTSFDGRTTSSVNTQSRSTGSAGDIEITVGQLVVENGASIFTSTLDQGNAGRLTVRATDSVDISGTSPDGQYPSSLRSDANLNAAPSANFSPGTANVLGSAGDLTLQAGALTIRDGGEITVSSSGKGSSAGNLNIQADTVLLDHRAILQAKPSSGTGGNITIDAQTVQLRHQSQFTTDASGDSTGGNITINTQTLAALENSDITANAQTGFGGSVTLNAQGIFGTAFRPAQTPDSDITASSERGTEFSGVVEILTPDVDPSSGLVQLPEETTDASEQVVAGCSAYADSQFVVTGRGGLPDDPTATVRPQTVWRDLQDFSDFTAPTLGNRSLEPSSDRREQLQSLSPEEGVGEESLRIIEATHWVKNDRSEVVLVANRPELQSSGLREPQCGDINQSSVISYQ
jgi:filamentous hemagglutinin family protein